MRYRVSYNSTNHVEIRCVIKEKVLSMAMCYDKLWKLLIDKKMSKMDLVGKSGISTNSLANMGKGMDVSTKVLRKICRALDCEIEDIAEIDHSE